MSCWIFRCLFFVVVFCLLCLFLFLCCVSVVWLCVVLRIGLVILLSDFGWCYWCCVSCVLRFVLIVGYFGLMIEYLMLLCSVLLW